MARKENGKRKPVEPVGRLKEGGMAPKCTLHDAQSKDVEKKTCLFARDATFSFAASVVSVLQVT